MAVAGDDGGAFLVALADDFVEGVLLGFVQGEESKVVKDEEVCVDGFLQAFGVLSGTQSDPPRQRIRPTPPAGDATRGAGSESDPLM